MDLTTASLIGLGILVLAVIAFFAVFRGKGEFTIKNKLGEVSAKGENSTSAPPGIDVGNVKAGRDANLRTAEGGIRAKDVTAERDVNLGGSSEASPPKK